MSSISTFIPSVGGGGAPQKYQIPSGTGAPTAPPENPQKEALYVNKTTSPEIISHWWDPATQTWKPLSSSSSLRFAAAAPTSAPTDADNDTVVVTSNGLNTGTPLVTYKYDKQTATWVATSITPTVRFGTTAPVALATDQENDTYVQTSNGLATGTPIATWKFDKQANVWVATSVSPTVRFGTTVPVALATDQENDTYVQTNNGLSSGVPIATYKFDKQTNVWVPINYNSNVRFGTTVPTALATDQENDTYVQTVDGTSTGIVVQSYVFDKNTNVWVPQAGPIADFWRSAPGGTVLPDGTTDVTENIRRSGRTGLNADPLSTLDVNGSFAYGIISTGAASYTALDSDHTINITSASAQSVVLPPANTVPRRQYILPNPTLVPKTVSSYIGLAGGASTTIPAQSSITVQSDGSVWREIDRYEKQLPGHTVSYGVSNTPPAATTVGQVYHQTSTGTAAGVLMNTWTWDGTTWFNESQPINVTRAQLLALRNGSLLRQSQHYLITDHVQNRLVAGTTILVHATADNEISESVTVNTTYDNEGWRGIYDIDRALVLELTDNNMNTCRGNNGTEVANFDWGNSAYINNRVEIATLTVTYGNPALVHNNRITQNASLNLTGVLAGFQFVNNEVQKSVVVSFSGANGIWRMSKWENGGSFNANNYTGGGDNYYNQFSSPSVNFSNTTSQIVFRQNVLNSFTINNIGLTAGTLTVNNSSFWGGGNITHAAAAGNVTINNSGMSNSTLSISTGTVTMTNSSILQGCTVVNDTDAGAILSISNTFIENGSIVYNRAVGTMSFNVTRLQNGGNIQRTNGATANLTILNSFFNSSSAIMGSTCTGAVNLTNQFSFSSSNSYNGTGPVNINGFTQRNSSSFTTDASTGGTTTISSVDTNNGTIRKINSSTAGNFILQGGTYVGGGSFIYHRGTGYFYINSCDVDSGSGIDYVSGDKQYELSAISLSAVSRMNLSGVAPARYCRIRNTTIAAQGTYTDNSTPTGGDNWFLNGYIHGSAGSFTMSGTTSDNYFFQVEAKNGAITWLNVTGGIQYHQYIESINGSNIRFENCSVNKPHYYISARNLSTYLNSGSTVAGGVQYMVIDCQGNYNGTGSCASVSEVHISQGVINHNGGVLNFVTKQMTGTLTTGNFNHSNIIHCSPNSRALTAANSSRSEFLGVTSTSPLI